MHLKTDRFFSIWVFTINGFFALGEELEWRDFLQDKLREYSFMKQAWITGILRGVWHLCFQSFC